jgi:hypothetical protein
MMGRLWIEGHRSTSIQSALESVVSGLATLAGEPFIVIGGPIIDARRLATVAGRLATVVESLIIE